jgi:alcohol dehydrogenase (cytochrome c)
VPANENFCGGFTGEQGPLVPGKLWLGTKPEDIGLPVRPGATHFGELQAWDPATGKKAWSHNFAKSQLFGSVTATAQRIQDALATGNNVGVENNVPQSGVVWVFAVKK